MSADPNMGFHFDAIQASALSRHAISFESGAINSTSGLVSVGNSVSGNSTSGMIMAGNSSMINSNHVISQIGNSAGGLLLDSAMGLKHDTGFAVEWSTDEQSRLEQGLVKFADEPTILRYIKIAAILRDKTVRDVALRCRWMTNERIGKRRKPEEHHTGRKMKDRKETLVESSKANVPRAPLQNLPVYSLMAPRMDKNEGVSCEAPAVSGTTRHLLDENAEVFSQIMNNLSTFKLQENIDLLYRTRNNIITILNNMRGTPGIMSQMPPLPVTINEDLANSVLPNTAQVKEFFYGRTSDFGSYHDDRIGNDVWLTQWDPFEARAKMLMDNSKDGYYKEGLSGLCALGNRKPSLNCQPSPWGFSWSLCKQTVYFLFSLFFCELLLI